MTDRLHAFHRSGYLDIEKLAPVAMSVHEPVKCRVSMGKRNVVAGVGRSKRRLSQLST